MPALRGVGAYIELEQQVCNAIRLLEQFRLNVSNQQLFPKSNVIRVNCKLRSIRNNATTTDPFCLVDPDSVIVETAYWHYA